MNVGPIGNAKQDFGTGVIRDAREGQGDGGAIEFPQELSRGTIERFLAESGIRGRLQQMYERQLRNDEAINGVVTLRISYNPRNHTATITVRDVEASLGQQLGAQLRRAFPMRVQISEGPEAPQTVEIPIRLNPGQ